MVLEKIPDLFLNYSNKNIDYFTCLTTCHILLIPRKSVAKKKKTDHCVIIMIP